MHGIEKEIAGIQAVLDILIEKKTYFETEMAKASDIGIKFSLKMQLKDLAAEIDEAKEKIRQLSQKSTATNNTAAVDGSGNIVIQGVQNSQINIGVQHLQQTADQLKQAVSGMQQASPRKIFFSYSKHDRAFLDAFLKHLAPLKRQGKIVPWDDSDLSPGEEWDDKIKSELAHADIIILLVSANFLATDYIWDVEIKTAMERHERGEARVVPIFLNHCDWSDTPFSKLSGLPGKGKPIADFANQDEAWMSVVTGIKKLLDFSGNVEKPAVAPEAITHTLPTNPVIDQPIIKEKIMINKDQLFDQIDNNEMDAVFETLDKNKATFKGFQDLRDKFIFDNPKGLELQNFKKALKIFISSKL